jgi:Cysteine-rich secretory protein family
VYLPLTLRRAAGDGNYGQNIGAGFTPGQIAFMITNAMYNGEMTKFPGPYGQDNIDTSTFGGWGHFSQIVWADTLQVGCATQFCPGGLANAGPNTPPYFTVCNYFPPGESDGVCRSHGADVLYRQLLGSVEQSPRSNRRRKRGGRQLGYHIMQ